MSLMRSLIGPYLDTAPAGVRYGSALALFGAALGIRIQLIPVLGTHSPLLALTLPVLLVACLVGRGPALLITLLAPLACTPFFQAQFTWNDPIGWSAHILLFLFISTVSVALIHQLQVTYRQMSESEARLRVATQSAHLGIVDWTLGTAASLWCNTRALELLGITSSDASIQNPAESLVRNVHPEDRQLLEQQLGAIDAHTQRLHLQLRLRNETTHDYRHIELLAAPTPTASSAVRLLGVVRDRTDEVLAHQRRARLESIVIASGDAIFSEGLDGRITSWNPAAERLFGHDSSIIGQAASALVPGELRAEDHSLVASVLREGSIITYETQRWRADGSTVAVAMTISSITTAEGRRNGVCRIVRDVSEQRRSNEALAKSEQRFRHLADAMPQIVFVLDAQQRVTYLNRRWQEYTGRLSASNDDLAAAIPREDLLRLFEAWSAQGAHERVQAIEFRLLSHAGEPRWFLSRAVPILNADGSIDMWIGTSTDIHDQKLAQSALLEADRRKDEFLAMLAHELRNPLAPVLNIASILEGRASDTVAVQQMSGILKRQTSHLARLVDDLLDVSRITRGKINLKHERLMLQSVIDRALESVHPLLIAKSQAIKLMAPPWPAVIEGDAVRLTQVLANLLMNASKYSPASSTIALTLATDANEARVHVRDRGIGIDGQALPHVFDLFMQGDQALDRPQGGLGIGLTIAKRLVELHGGRIEARSDGPGQGSEFIIALPLAPEVLPRRSDLDTHGVACRRIIVVDDNVDAAISLMMLLQMEGHEVRVAHDGHSTLSLLREFPADVALLDIGLPGIDGYALAEIIRERHGAMTPKLIALSGYAPEESLQNDVRFDAHLTKPVQMSKLLQTIATMMESSASASPAKVR